MTSIKDLHGTAKAVPLHNPNKSDFFSSL